MKWYKHYSDMRIDKKIKRLEEKKQIVKVTENLLKEEVKAYQIIEKIRRGWL